MFAWKLCGSLSRVAAEDPKRPALRVVAPGETAPQPETPRASPEPDAPPTEAAVFQTAVREADAQALIGAAYLTCAGAYLADAALNFYHSAAAHAPAGTFRHDSPPGLRSAEATRAWLETHLQAVKTMARAREAGAAPTAYERGDDTRRAAALAAEELLRSLEAARAAGLWFGERCAGLLRDAIEDLATVNAFLTHPVVIVEQAAPEAPMIAEPKSLADLYVLGLDVLGSSGPQLA